MTAPTDFSYRLARREDAESIFILTKLSISGLGRSFYSSHQIETWMGARTPSFYEDLIEKGKLHVCTLCGRIVGFVDSEPGEITRLFLLPDVAGMGVGGRLLEIGIAEARRDHDGPLRVESTLNAEGFYGRYGFRSIGKSFFSHGLGGEPIEIVIMQLGEP